MASTAATAGIAASIAAAVLSALSLVVLQPMRDSLQDLKARDTYFEGRFSEAQKVFVTESEFNAHVNRVLDQLRLCMPRSEFNAWRQERDHRIEQLLRRRAP
jgi:SpoU rRNA methylase family enzyme